MIAGLSQPHVNGAAMFSCFNISTGRRPPDFQTISAAVWFMLRDGSPCLLRLRTRARSSMSMPTITVAPASHIAVSTARIEGSDHEPEPGDDVAAEIVGAEDATTGAALLLGEVMSAADAD